MMLDEPMRPLPSRAGSARARLKVRTEDRNPQLWEHFEWLAATLMRLHPVLAFDLDAVYQTLDDRIAAFEADLRDLEAIRAVTASAPPTNRRRTGNRGLAAATPRQSTD
jgi:hypothetical protein